MPLVETSASPASSAAITTDLSSLIEFENFHEAYCFMCESTSEYVVVRVENVLESIGKMTYESCLEPRQVDIRTINPESKYLSKFDLITKFSQIDVANHLISHEEREESMQQQHEEEIASLKEAHAEEIRALTTQNKELERALTETILHHEERDNRTFRLLDQMDEVLGSNKRRKTQYNEDLDTL